MSAAECQLCPCDRAATEVYVRRVGFDSHVCDEHYRVLKSDSRAMWCWLASALLLLTGGMCAGAWLVMGSGGTVAGLPIEWVSASNAVAWLGAHLARMHYRTLWSSSVTTSPGT